MNVLAQITATAQATTTNDRGSVKKFVIATLSFAKHNGLKLSNAQVAELTRSNVPNAKTTAGSVADYVHKLNTNLYDYLTLDQASEALAAFDKGQDFTLAPTVVPEPTLEITPEPEATDSCLSQSQALARLNRVRKSRGALPKNV
jgi:hypothetical protein